MSREVLLFVLLIHAGVVVGVVIVWAALHHWQKTIWRRESGEEPRGFPVQPPDRRD